VRQHFNKLALILVLGSGFAIAQSSPQQPDQKTPPSQPTDQQQPSTAPAPDQNKTPDTMPSTDQKKDDSTKMPQSDAAPAAASGDVQGNIQSAIQKDPTLSTANVNVAVSGKTVELTGTVPNKDAKDTAERIAKENAGGMKVKSHLKVASAGSDTAPPKTK